MVSFSQLSFGTNGTLVFDLDLKRSSSTTVLALSSGLLLTTAIWVPLIASSVVEATSTDISSSIFEATSDVSEFQEGVYALLGVAGIRYGFVYGCIDSGSS